MISSLEINNFFRNPEFESLNLRNQQQFLLFIEVLIDGLGPAGLGELMEGSSKDINSLLYELFVSSHKALFGNTQSTHLANSQYLSNLAIEADFILSKNSCAYFIATKLPTFIMNWHHLEWCSFIEGYQKFCAIAYRGSGKSYFFSHALPLWKMYGYESPKGLERPKKNDVLRKYGMIFTYEIGLGEDFILLLKDSIESNEILRERLYPGSENTKEGWTKRMITTKNGARLQVKSYNSAARGRHPGWIVCDDLLFDNVLFSNDQNTKTINQFHSVIANMPLKGGPMYVTGTPFRTDDLYGNLKQSAEWLVCEYPGIFPNGLVLQPHRDSYEDLIKKKQTQGSLVFSREILCRPVSSDSTIFPYEMIAACFTPSYTLVHNKQSLHMKFKRRVLGLDFAMSANTGADFTVFITLGVDENEDYWLLNMYRTQGASYNTQIEAAKMLHAAFDYDIIYGESNQAQEAFLQGMRAAGLPAKSDHTGTNKYNFKDGLPSLALLFELRKIHIPTGNDESRKVAEMIAQEFSSIAYTDSGLKGVGSHDDIPMGFWKSIRAARYKNSFNFSFA